MHFYAHSKTGTTDENWQQIREHLLAVATISSRFAGKLNIFHAGELVGLAHDLGKYSDAFQRYLRKVTGDAAMDMEPDLSLKGSVDHSTAGAQIISGLAIANGETVSQMLATCIASHHSGLIDRILPDGTDGLTRRLNKATTYLTHRAVLQNDLRCRVSWMV